MATNRLASASSTGQRPACGDLSVTQMVNEGKQLGVRHGEARKSQHALCSTLLQEAVVPLE